MNMACGISQDLKEQKRINQKIERRLKQDKKDLQRESKLLLLGKGGSGKSTFTKHMKIIYGYGYSDIELCSQMDLMFRKIFMAMDYLIQAMETLGIHYANPSNRDSSNLIRQIDYESVASFDKPYVEAIMSLWNDEGVQECYNRRGEYQLPDSAKYFFDSVERISQPDYVPSMQDILRIRMPTIGITEYAFELVNINKLPVHIFRLVEIGRQISERRKWIHYFENVAAIIFFVALDEYDQETMGSDNGNQLEEAKTIFRETITSTWFCNIPVILLLNKRDVLEEKIMYSHLSDYFPEFNGPKRDASSAVQFIEEMFLKLSPDPDKIIFCQSICAFEYVITESILFSLKSSKLL